MLYKLLLILITFFTIICSDVFSQQINNDILEERIQKDEFTIIVVKHHQTKSQIKKKALTQAAKTSKKYGYKSFSIISEENVKVILGKKNWPTSYDFPQNIYQEEIIQRGFDSEKFISGSKPDLQTRQALKIKIKCHFKESEGAYKVCDLISC